MSYKKLFSPHFFYTIVFVVTLCFDAESQTVKIGTQVWCTKNLDVNIYRNGDTIPHVQDPIAWKNLVTGAWCYYENKTENGTIYGKLYNWFAVNDSRGIAPKGYHVPNDSEWTKLIDFLGGEDAAGRKMKNLTGWLKNGNGNNTSGFAGLPGGFRISDGTFESMGNYGKWWSTNESDSSNAMYHCCYTLNSVVGGYFDDKRNGYSIRCIAD